jgi:hypothetical protein
MNTGIIIAMTMIRRSRWVSGAGSARAGTSVAASAELKSCTLAMP